MTYDPEIHVLGVLFAAFGSILIVGVITATIFHLIKFALTKKAQKYNHEHVGDDHV
jgi:hypothetical protein